MTLPPSLPPGAGTLWTHDGAPSHRPLEAPARADVVVVGAGIVGLSLALRLAERGVDVVVLEAHRVGDGVSGSSTAKVSALHGTHYSRITRTYGPEVAAAYGAAQRVGSAQVREWLLRHGSDVERSTVTAYTATSAPSGTTTIEAEWEAASAAGLPVQHHVDTDVGLPFATPAAVSLADQMIIDPRAYLRALAGAVVDHGGRVHEDTPMTGLTRQEAVETARGPVRGDHVVLATGYPNVDRSGWFARLSVSRSYVIAVRVGDAHRVPSDAYLGIDEPGWSLRPAVDPRDGSALLLVGGGAHFPGRTHSELAHQERLRDFAVRHFGATEVVARWSAQDQTTADGLPAHGPMWGLPTRVQIATGFDKWGFTNGTAAAVAMADGITAERPEWARPFDARRVNASVSLPTMLSNNARVVAEAAGGWARKLGDELRASPVPLPRRGNGTGAAKAPVCTHLGGVLAWNDAEESWDCPLHGSRFSADGAVLQGPARRALPGR